MKRTFLLLTFFFLVSCVKVQLVNLNQSSDAVINKYKVSSANIQEYFQKVKGIPSTRASEIEVNPIVHDGDTVMFLVNYPIGWELLSGDRRAPRVLMRCDDGNVSIEELFESPLHASFMNSLKRNFAKASAGSFFSQHSFADSWPVHGFEANDLDMDHRVVHQLYSVVRDTLSLRVRDHLLTTKWGQNSVWSQNAPYMDSSRTSHCLTGCVPVAYAQTLYYLHGRIGKPLASFGNAYCDAYIPSTLAEIVLSYSDIDFSDYSSHWDEMPLSLADTTGAHLVSAFMMQIGLWLNAKYGRDGTSVLLSKMAEAPYFFSSNFQIACQLDTVSNNLQYLSDIIDDQVFTEEKPVILTISDDGVGHTVVVDGFKEIHEQVTYTYAMYTTGPTGFVNPHQAPEGFITNTVEEASQFAAVNWGWNGYCDSDSHGTIWYNVFAEWLASTFSFTDKSLIIHDFESTY